MFRHLCVRASNAIRQEKKQVCRAVSSLPTRRTRQSPCLLSKRLNSTNRQNLHGTRSNNRTAETTFLEKVANQQIQSGIVCQKVEELLLQLVTKQNIPSDGPLSKDLLNAALLHANPHKKVVPRLFSLAIEVMIQSGHPLASKEVQSQLLRLLDGHGKFFTNDLEYNTNHVNEAFLRFIRDVVSVSDRSKRKIDYETNQRIRQLMKRLEGLYEDTSVPLLRNAGGCQAWILYYCNQGHADKAYHLLKWMVNESLDYPIRLEPSVASFTHTIAAFAKCGSPDEALEIVQWMLSSYKDENTVMPAPNWTCFSALIDAWARSGRSDAGEKAEQTLEWMKQLHQRDHTIETLPDEVSYSSCINAWARSSHPEAPYRAEAILRSLIEAHQSGQEVAPSAYAFMSVMHAWAKSGLKEAPNRIRESIELMHEFSLSANTEVKVDAMPYSILIKAWETRAANSQGRQKLECGEEALKVLEEMKAAKVSIFPGIYNSIITMLSRMSPPSAVFYFLELEDEYRQGRCKLETRTFNCGLHAITAMNKPDASERASDVLQRMLEYSKSDPAVRPDETTFNIILKVLSRSNREEDALRANNLLLEMDAMPMVKPSQYSYLPCILAWGRTKSLEKFQRVADLLMRYEQSYQTGKLGGKPTVWVYNAVLSVCQHNEDPDLAQEAMDTARATIEQLRKAPGMRPDPTTYVTFFEIFASNPASRQEEDDSLMDREFEFCISDGLVSRDILVHLHRASPRVFEKYVGENADPATAPIPRSWSRNAGKRQRKA